MIRRSVLVSIVLVAVLLLGVAVWNMTQHRPAASVLEPTAQPTAVAQEPSIALYLVRMEAPAGSDGPTLYIFRVEGVELKGRQGAQVKVTPEGNGVVNENENYVLAYVPSDAPSSIYHVALQLEKQQAETTIAYKGKEKGQTPSVPSPALVPTSTPTLIPIPGPVLTPVPAPRATVVPTPIVQTCLPWPKGLPPMLSVLRVPDGLCLRETPENERIHLGGWGFIYPYNVIDFWFPDSPLPGYPLYIKPSESAQIGILAHGVCAAHQYQMVIDAGLEYDPQSAWEKTPEGIAYAKATGWQLKDNVWYKDGTAQEYLRPSGQVQQTCMARYGLGGYLSPQEQSWAERWLPLPASK